VSIVTVRSEPALFVGLVDLASAALGGAVVGVSDEFFAAAENMLLPEHARFDPERYTDRGKWMDGWESRRKRGPEHDWCVLRLGVRGRVYAFDVDTRHFVGNHPAFAGVEGVSAPRDAALDDLQRQGWRVLLPQSPLGPGARNLFAAEAAEAVTHVRLSIFPDGGVARFRVFGRVVPGAAEPEIDERSHAEGAHGLCDLAALKNGAVALTCSDARFGGMNNLLMPGRARHMGEGWETRRARDVDHRHDWIVVKLARRGTLRLVEIDTNHYKGNYPERASLEAIDAVDARTTDLIRRVDWAPILAAAPLRADHRHFYRDEIVAHGPITHVRLNVFPDGGISRLRLWGTAQ
jgi:allantoicase